MRADPVERRARLTLHLAALQQADLPTQLAAEEHVLEHRQRRDETRLLIDGTDAVLPRLLRRQRSDLLAGDENVAGIGGLRAGHDLDERRLARSVLADECVDLGREDLEGDVVERGDAAVVLRDAARSDERSLEVLHSPAYFTRWIAASSEWLSTASVPTYRSSLYCDL